MLHYLANCSAFVFGTYNYFLALYPATCYRIFSNHSHKKKSSLETCARLFFISLQDLFASARLHRVHKNFSYRKVQYVISVT